ncbi:MAG: hypothetical protein Q9194_006523 [Teloschistes cf. exilis]
MATDHHIHRHYHLDVFDREISQPLPDSYSKCLFLHYLHHASFQFGSIFEFEVGTLSDTTYDDIPNFFHGGFKDTDDGFQAFFIRYAYLHQLAAGHCKAIEDCTYRHLFNAAHILRTEHQHRLAMVGLLEKSLESTGPPRLVAFQIRPIASTLLNLAASLLLLTLACNPIDRIPFDDPVPWDGLHHLLPTLDDPDRNHISQQFSPPTPLNSVKLPQSFTAAHLEHIAGMRIRWTHKLAHHLLLRDDDTTLVLFHHACALHQHIQT